MPPKLNSAQAAYAQKMMQSMGGDAMKGLLNSKKLKKAAKKMGNPMMEKIAGNKNITDAIMENKEMTSEIMKTMSSVKEPTNPEEMTKIMSEIMSNEVIMTGMMDTSSKVLKEIQEDKDMADWFQTSVGEWIDVVKDDPEIAQKMQEMQKLLPKRDEIAKSIRCGIVLYGDAEREAAWIKEFSFEMAQSFISQVPSSMKIMLDSKASLGDTGADAIVVLCSNIATNITKEMLPALQEYDENVFTAVKDTFKTHGKEVKSRNTFFLPFGCAFAVGSTDESRAIRRIVFAPSNPTQEARALGAAATLCEMKGWKRVAIYSPSLSASPKHIEWPENIDKKGDYTIICK
jgi:hypothetical protein